MINHHHSSIRAISVAISFCLLAILACSLQAQDDEPTSNVPATLPFDRPFVDILSPENDSTFTVGQPITVQVMARDQSGTGVTRVELLASNVLVDQKPSQNPAGDPEMAVNLTWNAPTAPGSVTLTVRPWRGLTAGSSSRVRVIVTDTFIAPTVTLSSSITSPIPPTTDTTCRARVDAQGLRFRSTPDTSRSDNIMGNFNLGDEPRAVGRLSDNSWYQVQSLSGSTTGWVSGAYVTLRGICNLPVTLSLATPTLPSTPTPAAQPAPPDLIALSPSGLVNVSLPIGGVAEATYTLDIWNVGGSDSGAFRVEITLPGGQPQLINVTNLAPGNRITLPSDGLRVVFSEPGPQRISYRVDVDNIVAEADEGNNIAWLDVTVDSSP